MLNKRLYTLAVNFNESDIDAMRGSFHRDQILLLADVVNGESVAVEKFRSILPDVVIINIVNDMEDGMDTIRNIYSITDSKNPPFFIVALSSDETDARKDPVLSAIVKTGGYYFYRYGYEHTIESIIRFVEVIAPSLKSREERQEQGVVWLCEKK